MQSRNPVCCPGYHTALFQSTLITVHNKIISQIVLLIKFYNLHHFLDMYYAQSSCLAPF